MHNFDELQKRCKKYKLKKTFTYLFLSGIGLASLVALFLFIQAPLAQKRTIKHISTIEKIDTQKNKILNTQKQEKKQITKKEKKTTHNTLKTYSLQFLVIKKENILRAKKRKKILEYIGFKNCKLTQHGKYIYLTCNEVNDIKNLSKYIKLAKKEKLNYFIDTQYFNKEKEIKKRNSKKQNTQKTIIKKILKTQKATTPMLKVQTVDLQQLQKEFFQTPNYNIALLIAHNYFNKKAYKKAIFWAKKANKLNKSDADSWILYAKSLHALQRNKQAMQLLHIYLQYENSDEATHLLQQWERTQ